MTSDSSDLLLEHAVPEPSLELSLSLGGGGDAHRVLSSSEDHVRSSGGDGGRVEGSVGGEGLEDHQVVGSVQLKREIRGMGSQVSGRASTRSRLRVRPPPPRMPAAILVRHFLRRKWNSNQ